MCKDAITQCRVWQLPHHRNLKHRHNLATLNAKHGGWDADRTKTALALMQTLYDGKINLSPLRG